MRQQGNTAKMMNSIRATLALHSTSGLVVTDNPDRIKSELEKYGGKFSFEAVYEGRNGLSLNNPKRELPPEIIGYEFKPIEN